MFKMSIFQQGFLGTFNHLWERRVNIPADPQIHRTTIPTLTEKVRGTTWQIIFADFFLIVGNTNADSDMMRFIYIGPNNNSWLKALCIVR